MLKKIKPYRYLVLSIVIMIIIIGISFFQSYYERISYTNDYNQIKKYCYEKKDPNHESCALFKTDGSLEKYIVNGAPEKIIVPYDAITLTCTIVENTLFSTMQYFSPFIIVLAVLGTVHSQFSSGMFENYLLRMKYKKYLKKTYKIAIKAALIMPIALIAIFIISSILTGFNFDISNIDPTTGVYDAWKYENFLLYGSSICLMQFFISMLYANISLCCCRKNKNKIVAILMSYITFIVVDIIIYVVIYALIMNNVLGIKGLTDYFNIAGYWFFEGNINVFIPALIAFVLQVISTMVVYRSFKNKERVVLSYEKQVS